MRARGWVVAGILAISPVLAADPGDGDPKPVAVDIKAMKDRLQVFQDKAGGTYVVYYNPDSSEDARVWYGAGKQLYEQRVIGRSRNGDAWSVDTWAPRVAQMRPGSVMRKDDGSFMKWCDGKDDAVLSKLTGDKAKAIVDKYQFMSRALVRIPVLLARDDSGIYYYVDRLDAAHGGKGYRVFVGKKGGMKLQQLTDVASDAAGQVFSTKTGDLRLVTAMNTDNSAQQSAKWIRGEKKTELVQLDLDVNSPVIFSDLGIYKFTGTLCDNI